MAAWQSGTERDTIFQDKDYNPISSSVFWGEFQFKQSSLVVKYFGQEGRAILKT